MKIFIFINVVLVCFCVRSLSAVPPQLLQNAEKVEFPSIKVKGYLFNENLDQEDVRAFDLLLKSEGKKGDPVYNTAVQIEEVDTSDTYKLIYDEMFNVQSELTSGTGSRLTREYQVKGGVGYKVEVQGKSHLYRVGSRSELMGNAPSDSCLKIMRSLNMRNEPLQEQMAHMAGSAGKWDSRTSGVNSLITFKKYNGALEANTIEEYEFDPFDRIVQYRMAVQPANSSDESVPVALKSWVYSPGVKGHSIPTDILMHSFSYDKKTNTATPFNRKHLSIQYASTDLNPDAEKYVPLLNRIPENTAKVVYKDELISVRDIMEIYPGL